MLVCIKKEEKVGDEVGGRLVHCTSASAKAKRTIHLVGAKVRIGFFFGRFDFGFVLDIDSTAVLEVTRVDFIDLPSAMVLVQVYL